MRPVLRRRTIEDRGSASTAEDLTDEKWARLQQTLLESKGDDDAREGRIR